jgi:hypothetical protein
MIKSALATTIDEMQARLNPLLRQSGFRKYGRTYNRITPDGLTHVVGFQPGLRSLYGRFTVNLGVYVPEVARNHGGGEAKSVVHDYSCCIRTRLGRSAKKELWWTVSASDALVSELQERFQNEAIPLFQRFENRDQILSEFRTAIDNTELMAVPRIVCAIREVGCRGGAMSLPNQKSSFRGCVR